MSLTTTWYPVVNDENGMVPVVVRMPKAMHDALKRCAEREDRTMAQTLRRAIRRYLAEDESA